jgi:DNA-binding transcriptional ArsR family regulator
MDQELVFKALADVSRRKLLDLLFIKNGRSLGELSAHLEKEMTRFGVMKHLKILKQAGLVTTRKQGRETLHFLNPVPIQMVYDRWVSKYSKGWARSLTELKYELEDKNSE